MKNKNILVTGGAGLIGSHLCEYLIKAGNKVTCVDNFITGKKENIKALQGDLRFSFIEADVATQALTYLPKQSLFDEIYHLASPAAPKAYQLNPVATYLVNGIGTHYLLEYARQSKSRFLFASTSEVYGDPKVHPQKEEYWGNVNPLGSRACYDESKRFGEMVSMTFWRKFQVDVRIARIFNTYGPRNDRDDGRVVPNFIQQAIGNEPLTVYGDGSQTRSFCFVADLVDGLVKLMESDKTSGEVVNLGNPDEFTIGDFANLVIKIASSRSTIEFEALPEDDPKQRKPDISKAMRLLNWQPVHSIEQGLIKTIEYFRS